MLQLLPLDDSARLALHDEVHARPAARIQTPARVVYVAVLNDGVTRTQEAEHLRQLPGQQTLDAQALRDNFLRLQLPGYTLKWERHSEFSRYSIVQALDPSDPGSSDLSTALRVAPEWLRGLPGRTMAAIDLVMLHADIGQAKALLEKEQWRFGGASVLASKLGGGHSCAMTDFQIGADGFERMLVLAPPDISDTRAGRIAQRLLELETYRLMALKGLPVAKSLAPLLAECESGLADITAKLDDAGAAEQDLLAQLIGLAARVESATAAHSYRFSATQAYDAIVRQRIAELRELPIPGTQTLGEFMQRRLSPAMATVAASAQRLAALSQRIERTSGLLRTRVDIATEAQNHQLLAQLTRGQALQLQLQGTVEGLSIAAISYYVVSLLLYLAKAGKAAGLPLNPELAAGVMIPLVLWGVWHTVRRIHAKLQLGS